MSSGPIKEWRDSWLPERASVPQGERVCAQQPGTLRGMCGRKPKSLRIASDPKVTCPECLAAIRADQAAQTTTALAGSDTPTRSMHEFGPA